MSSSLSTLEYCISTAAAGERRIRNDTSRMTTINEEPESVSLSSKTKSVSEPSLSTSSPTTPSSSSTSLTSTTSENEGQHEIPANVLEYVAKIREAIANQSIAAQAQRDRERESAITSISSEARADGIVAPPSSPWYPSKKRSSSLIVLTGNVRDGLTSLVSKGKQVTASMARTGRGKKDTDVQQQQGEQQPDGLPAKQAKKNTRRWSLAFKMSKMMSAKSPAESVSSRPSNAVATSRFADDECPYDLNDSDAITLTDDAEDCFLLPKTETIACKYDLRTGVGLHEAQSISGQLRKSVSRILNGVENLTTRASRVGREAHRWSRL